MHMERKLQQNVTTPQLHTLPHHYASCKQLFKSTVKRGVSQSLHSLPKQMHVVTGGWMQGFTTPGGCDHTAFVQSGH